MTKLDIKISKHRFGHLSSLCCCKVELFTWYTGLYMIQLWKKSSIYTKVCMYGFVWHMIKHVYPKLIERQKIICFVNILYPTVLLQDSSHPCIRQLKTHACTNSKTLEHVKSHICWDTWIHMCVIWRH